MKADTEDYIAAFIGVLCAAIIFFAGWVGVNTLINERKCYARGYPEAHTDYTGQGYCVTMDGAVRVPVEKLP